MVALLNRGACLVTNSPLTISRTASFIPACTLPRLVQSFTLFFIFVISAEEIPQRQAPRAAKRNLIEVMKQASVRQVLADIFIF